MMLAMLPTISRLPASVLTSASSGPARSCRATGSSSITAGTFETMFDSTSVAANSGGGFCRSMPRRAEARRRSRGYAGAAQRVVDDEQPGEQHQQLPVHEAQHLARVQRRLISSTPAPASAATSRGTA